MLSFKEQMDELPKASGLAVLTAAMIKRYGQLNLALLDQIVVSGVNFVTGFLLARFLGIEEFGRYTLVWMLLLLVSMVQLSTLLYPMMSLGPKQPEGEMPSYFGAVSFLQVIFCLFWGVFTLALGEIIRSYFPQWHIATLTTPMMAVVIAFQAQEFIRRYFFTRHQIALAFMNDLISYGGQLALLIGFSIIMPLKTDTVLWIIALTSALATVVGSFKVAPMQLSSISLKSTFLKHWHFSKWLTVGAFLQWIGGQFFVMVSAAFFSAAAAGAIAAARNILGLTLVLFSAMDNVVSVRASLLFKQGGWISLKRYITKVSLYGGLANGLICLIAALFAPFWMGILFGEKYQAYCYLVYWFSATHFIMFFIRPLISLLRSVEYTRPIATSSILPMILSVIASIPLIKLMGLSGAMVIMLCSQILLLIYLLVATIYWRKAQHS